MSFPALDAFAEDPTIEQVAWKVYMHLQRALLHHREPRAVKVDGLCETLHIRPASIIAALNQLTDRGYLVEHERAARGVRWMTLAWSVPSAKSA